ncbi:MAG: sigma-70 family RNA polymerase sigma factor [Armatimonadetes bacterium]|nr:sigma-70 family RNA polymerase sigma factor [Armatimonadota bacterium]
MTDSFFRHESGKVVAMLVKSFGPEHLQLAEDVVQEAIGRALRTWPFYGVPDNPAGWITQTAKNLALDALRRDQVVKKKQVQMFGSVHKWSSRVDEIDFENFGEEVEDALLRFMFVCCHPEIAENTRHVLALKTLCGFSVREISHALLANDATIGKRLTRAKEKLAEGNVTTQLPVGPELEPRLNGVLTTLYLLFNEGYKASSGENLVREELCAEAIRLTSILAGLPVGDKPRVHALLALMLLSAARLNTRVDGNGNMLLLKDQDRSKWDRELIDQGLWHLGQSATGNVLDRLHLQAAIAAAHSVAPNYESTDWASILLMYDELLALDPSPVVALNRAVAVGIMRGARLGIVALDEIAGREQLDSYYLYFAVRAEFELELGRSDIARELLEKASTLTDTDAEKAFLNQRMAQIQVFSQ